MSNSRVRYLLNEAFASITKYEKKIFYFSIFIHIRNLDTYPWNTLYIKQIMLKYILKYILLLELTKFMEVTWSVLSYKEIKIYLVSTIPLPNLYDRKGSFSHSVKSSFFSVSSCKLTSSFLNVATVQSLIYINSSIFSVLY